VPQAGGVGERSPSGVRFHRPVGHSATLPRFVNGEKKKKPTWESGGGGFGWGGGGFLQICFYRGKDVSFNA